MLSRPRSSQKPEEVPGIRDECLPAEIRRRGRLRGRRDSDSQKTFKDKRLAVALKQGHLTLCEQQTYESAARCLPLFTAGFPLKKYGKLIYFKLSLAILFPNINNTHNSGQSNTEHKLSQAEPPQSTLNPPKSIIKVFHRKYKNTHYS